MVRYTAALIFLAPTCLNAFSTSGRVAVNVKGIYSPHRSAPPTISSSRKPTGLFSYSPKEEDDNDTPINPYADPNYPDIEFVNYDDPEYSSGIEDFDENTSPDTTEDEIEAMREERRRRNDEYQFETYHAKCLKSGEVFKGEWTIYRASTFMDGVDEKVDVAPRFKVEEPTRMISKGEKIFLDLPDGIEEFEFRVDAERLVHEERPAENHDFEEKEEWEAVLKNNPGEHEDIIGKKYTPAQMSAFDFRGSGGSMCVGNCYTVSDAVSLKPSKSDALVDDVHEGPFSEYRSEIGIQYKRMRYRVKWDYRVKDEHSESETPALHLYSMTVCREMRERWPRYISKQNVDESSSERLFGAPGANGGLFDPPLVGDEQQASQYISLNLEGGATVLFPHKIDQDPKAHDGKGWVQTLDWCPGRLRYQADKKIKSGKDLRCLRTLELSEIQGDDSDRWRPNDSGTDMLQ